LRDQSITTDAVSQFQKDFKKIGCIRFEQCSKIRPKWQKCAPNGKYLIWGWSTVLLVWMLLIYQSDLSHILIIPGTRTKRWMSQQQRGLLGRPFVCVLIIHLLMLCQSMSVNRIVHMVFWQTSKTHFCICTGPHEAQIDHNFFVGTLLVLQWNQNKICIEDTK